MGHMNTYFIEDIIQVLRNQGGGRGGYGQILHPDNRGGWGSEKALTDNIILVCSHMLSKESTIVCNFLDAIRFVTELVYTSRHCPCVQPPSWMFDLCRTPLHQTP